MVDEASLNLSVIQSYDQYCTQIVDKSASAHVYLFDNKTNSWVKSKIGGVFFLYKRSKAPHHSFMILNRKSPDWNQIEHVTAALQLQLHTPFLLYKTAKGDIFSIWFFSEDDCVRIAECLGKMVYDSGGLGLRVASAADSKNNLVGGNQGNRLLQSQATAQGLSQLMNFIRRSGDSTDERNSKRTSGITHVSGSTQISKGNAKVKQPSQPKPSEAPNLFEMLQKAEVDYNSETSRKSNPVAEPNINTELQRLRTACNITSSTSKGLASAIKLSNGTPASLGIRSTPTLANSSPPHRSGHHISVAELEQQLLQEHTSKVPAYFAGDEATDESSNDDVTRPSAFKLSQPQPIRSVAAESDAHCPPTSTRLLSDLDAGYADDIDEAYDEDTLMSDKGHRKPRRHSRHHEAVEQSHLKASTVSRSPWPEPSVANDDPEEVEEEEEEALVTPAMLISPPPPASTFGKATTCANANRTPNDPTNKISESPDEGYTLPVRNSSREGLTKEQLREALVHIIQTDDEFLHRIHSAYIASLQRRIVK